jgi:hypothetical protein
MRRKNPRRRISVLTGGASRSMTNYQRSSSSCGTHLRLIACLALVAAVDG